MKNVADIKESFETDGKAKSIVWKYALAAKRRDLFEAIIRSESVNLNDFVISKFSEYKDKREIISYGSYLASYIKFSYCCGNISSHALKF